MRHLPRFVLVLLVALTAALGLAVAPAAAAPPTSWVATWAAPPTRPSSEIGSIRTVTDTTLRQVAHLSAGGDAVRVTLSNEYGTTPLRLGAVTVGTSTGGAVVTRGSLQRLTFSGARAITIPAGARVVSDAVTMSVAQRSDLAVSMWFPGATGPLDVHPFGLAQGFSGAGDLTRSAGAGFAGDDLQRFVVSRIDVRTTGTPAVVFFGDSITDGFGSTADADQRYPDLAGVAATAPIGVVNAGISANELVADGDWQGDAGVRRFGRDVTAVPGVTTVVVLIGINDLYQSDTSRTAIEDGYRAIVSQAHAAGIRVIGATLTPNRGFEAYTARQEQVRQQLNTDIRTSGLFDDVVDFDAVVRDPAVPTRLRPAFDSGDHLHPNDLGYRAMGAAVAPLL